MYPVYFSASDTSGEKAYEEFYTSQEQVDLGRFLSLGVITGRAIPDKGRVVGLLQELEAAFQKKGVAKEDVVGILRGYLPNFNHLETGKSLDSKM